MEKENFKFKSQICTTIEQSERLLALGLKKGTADMGWVRFLNGVGYVIGIAEDYSFIDIPAWSLHRLMEIGEMRDIDFSDISKIYDTAVRVIECRIHAGLINPEYLEEKK